MLLSGEAPWNQDLPLALLLREVGSAPPLLRITLVLTLAIAPTLTLTLTPTLTLTLPLPLPLTLTRQHSGAEATRLSGEAVALTSGGNSAAGPANGAANGAPPPHINGGQPRTRESQARVNETLALALALALARSFTLTLTLSQAEVRARGWREEQARSLLPTTHLPLSTYQERPHPLLATYRFLLTYCLPLSTDYLPLSTY